MILFIDDEKLFNESYVEALEEAGYQVIFERNLNKAITLLESKPKNLELIIFDVMFPLPTKLNARIDPSKTQDGMRVGEELLRIMNSIEECAVVPKIILTNIASEEFYAKHHQDPELCRCLRKRNTLPSELVETVAQCLAAAAKGE